MYRPNTVLIVDDDPRWRSVVRRCLSTAGYRTLEAEQGDRALQLLREYRDKIHVVLLDIVIPESSGLDIFDRIREEFPGVGIIVSSVYSKEEQEFLVWDAEGYYYKSDSLFSLEEQIDKILKTGYSFKKEGGDV